MHKLLRKLLAVLVVGGLASFVAGSTAKAGTFDPDISTMAFGLGGLPNLTLTGQSSGTANFATDMSWLSDASSIWITTNYTGGTAAFTGVPAIDDLLAIDGITRITLRSGQVLLYAGHLPQGLFVVTRGVIACEPEKRFHVEFQQNAALNDLDVNETFHWVPDLVGTSNVRLDDLLADSPDPVLLKIDVEGAEVDVLKSGRAILDRGTTMAVIETHSAELENTCRATLAVLGYNVITIQPAPWRAIAPERRLLPHNRWLVALGPETPRTLIGRASA